MPLIVLCADFLSLAGMWIDYGISGHTGIPALLFLHFPSWTSFVVALAQTALAVATRDHYSIDVMHSWVFAVAICGRFDAVILSGSR